MAEAYSRTRKSMRNSVAALVVQVLAMLAGFFSRKIFIDHLGTEVLGLNTTALSILNGLNLLELGIWSAVAITLYKPLYDNDKKAVQEIVALHGWLYRIICATVVAGSLVVMCFFPQIFSKSELPLWYPYATFGVLLYSTALEYLVNYPRAALYADQQNYKIVLCARMIALVKLICQAVAVYCSKYGYIWWVVLEAVFSTIGAFVTRIVVYKSLPYLSEKVRNPGRLRFRYSQVLEKVKYLSFHKISSFAGTYVSPIIIYAYSSLSMVALYGNYIILTGNLASMLSSVFSGVDASVGNMVAEGNRKLKMKVFGELFSSRFFIVAVCTICLWLLANPFISMWLGPEYMMERTTVFLIVAAFFLGSSRLMVQGFVDAHGDFSDIWAPLTELALNVGLSVLGGWYYGLNGILACSLVSQLLIGHIWKPYFLFCKVMKEPLSFYVRLLLQNLLIACAGGAVVVFIFKRIPIDASASILAFLLAGTIALALCVVIMGGLLYAFNESARSFVARMLNVFAPGRKSY